jgi:UDP-glucose 4-epimerase
MGVLNVLEYSRKNGNIPVVFAGSASRYGNVYDNPYAFSKYQGEQLCKMYSELYGVPTSVCRFFNVYGPNAPTEGQYVGVIGIFSRLFKEGRPLTITGDGTQTRDFIHVKDVVDGLVRCSNSYYARDNLHTTFDFGTGKSYSLNEIANAFGENYPSTYIDERRGEIKHSVCDPTFTKEELEWETKIDVIDYIKNTYNHG